MARVPLKLIGGSHGSADELSIQDRSVRVRDGYKDDFSSLCKRPGLASFSSLGIGNGVDGTYWWEAKGVTIAVAGGRVYSVDVHGVATDVTGDSLRIGNTVSFATDGTVLLMANGGRMVYYLGSGTTTFIADLDAPLSVSSLGYIDGYFLANSVGTGKLYFCEAYDYTDWRALNFVTAEADSDTLDRIFVRDQAVYLMGKKTIEEWYNDGETPFSKTDSGFIQRGIGATASLAEVGGMILFMDTLNRVVTISGRKPVSVSDDLDMELQRLGDASDAIAYPLEIDGNTFYVASLPLANRTIVYDAKRKLWYDWGTWNTAHGGYDRWRVGHIIYAEAWKKWIGGDWSTGELYEITWEAYDDNGADIRTLARTGQIDHGTLARKRCDRLDFRAKRGTGEGSTASPVVMVRWKDDGKSWGSWREVSLGPVGDTGAVKSLHRLGMYRSRQYEVVHSNSSPMILVSLEETVEVLSS